MNIENKYNYHTLISHHVRYNDKLKPFAKLLYAEIEFLQRKHGYCFISNQVICKLFNVSEATVTRSIRHLAKENLIRIELSSYRDSDGRIKSVRKIYLIEVKKEKEKDKNSSAKKPKEQSKRAGDYDTNQSILPPIKNGSRFDDRSSINHSTAPQSRALPDPQKEEHNVTRQNNNTREENNTRFILLLNKALPNYNEGQKHLLKVLTKFNYRQYSYECDDSFAEQLISAIGEIVFEFDPLGENAAKFIKEVENNNESKFNIKYKYLINKVYEDCKLK